MIVWVVVAANVMNVSIGAEGEKKPQVTFEVNKNTLQGEYHGSSGSICFYSEANKDGHSLAVTTLEGNPIVSSRKPKGSSMMTLTIGGTKFVTVMNQPDFVVPADFHDYVELALEQNRIMPIVALQYFSARNADMTRKEAVDDLISRGEPDLIVEAAKALGNAGVMGPDSPAAQKFFVLAMRLEKIKKRLQNQAESNINDHLPHSLFQSVSSESDKDTCAKMCTTGKCPYYGKKSYYCEGMCGYKCTCWKFVCGDCCVHQGCLEHDRCCETYWSLKCLVPIKFSCTHYPC